MVNVLTDDLDDDAAAGGGGGGGYSGTDARDMDRLARGLMGSSADEEGTSRHTYLTASNDQR